MHYKKIHLIIAWENKKGTNFKELPCQIIMKKLIKRFAVDSLFIHSHINFVKSKSGIRSLFVFIWKKKQRFRVTSSQATMYLKSKTNSSKEHEFFQLCFIQPVSHTKVRKSRGKIKLEFIQIRIVNTASNYRQTLKCKRNSLKNTPECTETFSFRYSDIVCCT